MASSPSRPPLALVTIVLLGACLGACRADRAATTGSIYPHDVRERHPYVLADGTRSLDIFPTGIGHLDPRQAGDLDGFLLEFRRYGRGTLAIDIPRGGAPGTAAAAERTGAAIRRIAGENGLPARNVIVSSYAISDPGLAAPVRLSFQRMEGKVAGQCGLWPQDLGTADASFNIRNEPYWNLGCATRSTMAAQVADPVDLVRGREEGRIDTVRRTQVINKLREGNDPSTTWRQDGTGKTKAQIN